MLEGDGGQEEGVGGGGKGSESHSDAVPLLYDMYSLSVCGLYLKQAKKSNQKIRKH